MKQPSIQPKKCPKCARMMVALTLDIADEKKTLRSCSHCDLRMWETDTGGTTLESVLTALSDTTDD